jgi:hypothetical protein
MSEMEDEGQKIVYGDEIEKEFSEDCRDSAEHHYYGGRHSCARRRRHNERKPGPRTPNRLSATRRRVVGTVREKPASARRNTITKHIMVTITIFLNTQYLTHKIMHYPVVDSCVTGKVVHNIMINLPKIHL